MPRSHLSRLRNYWRYWSGNNVAPREVGRVRRLLSSPSNKRIESNISQSPARHNESTSAANDIAQGGISPNNESSRFGADAHVHHSEHKRWPSQGAKPVTKPTNIADRIAYEDVQCCSSHHFIERASTPRHMGHRHVHRWLRLTTRHRPSRRS